MFPLSQLITAFPEIPTTAEPFSAGVVAVIPPSNATSITLETEAHPKRSAIPGPVEPAPESAAVLPQ
ncbi:MAG: Uncharacterised protein [Methanobacteriota archaeon]|nr:MAG: Uncharacterised protein [Euryarchaeota archaeon]